MTTKVNVAKKEELGEICAFIMNTAETMEGWSLVDFPLDFYNVSEAVLDCFINGQIFFVRNKLLKIEGCILLIEQAPWFSKTPCISDKAFIVVNNPSTQNLAKSLLLASKAYAKIKGMKLLISIYTDEKNELKERFFKVNGFKISGFTAISG